MEQTEETCETCNEVWKECICDCSGCRNPVPECMCWGEDPRDDMGGLEWNYMMAGHDHSDELEHFNCDLCRKRSGLIGAPSGYHDKYCEVCRQQHKGCRCHEV